MANQIPAATNVLGIEECDNRSIYDNRLVLTSFIIMINESLLAHLRTNGEFRSQEVLAQSESSVRVAAIGSCLCTKCRE